ncbi:MAG: hypothetical protein ABSE52_06020 [Candidatus Dormibacteria bacterium]
MTINLVLLLDLLFAPYRTRWLRTTQVALLTSRPGIDGYRTVSA